VKWVNSAGGPFLFLDEVLLSNWHGSAGGHAEQSDYERACLADDLIVPINIGNGFGVVLNDEPLQTAWLPSEKQGQSFLTRWRHAKSEITVIRHLEQIPEAIFDQEGVSFTVPCGRCILFDSALPGPDFRKGEFLELMLEPGDYEIRTGFFEPDSETSLIIHRLSILTRRSRNQEG
jgi:frataxin-like iron-binding protein CyaY